MPKTKTARQLDREIEQVIQRPEGEPPGISKWHQFAGGTAAAPGKYSYSFATGNGEYHIWPISSQRGRHLGYSLKFAATRRLPSAGGGLWHDLGSHRSPQDAARVARRHHGEAFS